MLTDIGAAALLIAIFVQTTKFLLNYAVSPTSPNQNNFTRLFVFAVAIVLVLGTDWAYNGLHNHADVINAIKFALSAGAVAIASYHLLTSDTIPTLGVSLAVPAKQDAASIPLDKKPSTKVIVPKDAPTTT